MIFVKSKTQTNVPNKAFYCVLIVSTIDMWESRFRGAATAIPAETIITEAMMQNSKTGILQASPHLEVMIC